MTSQPAMGAVVAALSVSGCGSSPSSEEGTVSVDGADTSSTGVVLAEEAMEPLEAGNVAYREKDYAAALSAYRVAMDTDRRHPSPALGAFMAAEALGDSAAAAAAREAYEARLAAVTGTGS